MTLRRLIASLVLLMSFLGMTVLAQPPAKPAVTAEEEQAREFFAAQKYEDTYKALQAAVGKNPKLPLPADGAERGIADGVEGDSPSEAVRVEIVVEGDIDDLVPSVGMSGSSTEQKGTGFPAAFPANRELTDKTVKATTRHADARWRARGHAAPTGRVAPRSS